MPANVVLPLSPQWMVLRRLGNLTNSWLANNRGAVTRPHIPLTFIVRSRKEKVFCVRRKFDKSIVWRWSMWTQELVSVVRQQMWYGGMFLVARDSWESFSERVDLSTIISSSSATKDGGRNYTYARICSQRPTKNVDENYLT